MIEELLEMFFCVEGLGQDMYVLMRIPQSSYIFYHHNFILHFPFVLQQMPSIGENFIDPEAALAAKEQEKQARRERKEKRRKEREARREARQKERERLRLLKEEMEKKQEEEKQSSDTEDEVLIRVSPSLQHFLSRLETVDIIYG